MTEALAIKETFIPESMRDEVDKAFRKDSKAIQCLEAALNPDNAGVSASDISRIHGISRQTWYYWHRVPTFTNLLTRISEMRYPALRSELACRIIQDALTPMKDAFRVEHSPRGGPPEVIPYHASIVKTREQAAAILGLMLKQPDVSFSKNIHEHQHMFAKVEDKHLEEFARTQEWPAEAGPPPWKKG